MLIVIAGITLITILTVKRKTITIIIDGKSEKVVTYDSTVKETLKDENIQIGPKDKIIPTLDTKLSENDVIKIKKAVSIRVHVDGKDLSVLSSEDNLANMLKSEKIVLNTMDKISPGIDTELSSGLTVKITRVVTKTLIDSVPIDFKTVIKYDSSMPNTEKKVEQAGEAGERKVTTLVTYEDGIEVLRNIISDIIISKPMDSIMTLGTYPVAPMSRGGDPLPYSRVLQVRATAYWATRGVGHTYTSTGRLAVRNPDGYSTIAVDPNVIPYGTKLFVEGYGFAIAADCGSAIKGNTIDVFFNTNGEACDWAVKYVNVYILK